MVNADLMTEIGTLFQFQALTNGQKAEVVDAYRTKYPLEQLLAATGLARSSYYYAKQRASHTRGNQKRLDIFQEIIRAKNRREGQLKP